MAPPRPESKQRCSGMRIAKRKAINVDVADGNVTLSGIVDAWAAGAAPGVRNVVDHMAVSDFQHARQGRRCTHGRGIADVSGIIFFQPRTRHSHRADA